jgi:hypothetical protein
LEWRSHISMKYLFLAPFRAINAYMLLPAIQEQDELVLEELRFWLLKTEPDLKEKRNQKMKNKK